jgi:Cu/Ag efflux protein CusF
VTHRLSIALACALALPTSVLAQSTSVTTAAAKMPGVRVQAGEVEVLAVIQALDRKAGTATLRGAKRTFSVEVPAGVDIKKLKVGDEVRAVFAEATVLSVERAGQ